MTVERPRRCVKLKADWYYIIEFYEPFHAVATVEADAIAA
jgi:hypothetical protein